MSFDEPLTLPAVPVAPTRASFPVVATIVPLIGGVALWAIIGSPFALLFALLGPLVALGGLIDHARSGRRQRARSEVEYARALAEVEAAAIERQSRERSELRAKHPDVAAFALRAEQIWRAAPPGSRDLAVLGHGRRPSMTRLTGDTSRPEAERLRRASARLADAPLTADWRGGIAVRGEPSLALAVLRALVLQLCLTHTPETLRIESARSDKWEWMSGLPHHQAPSGALPNGERGDGPTRVVVGPAGAGPTPTGVLLTWGSAGSTIDPRCGVVLDVREPDDATLVIGVDRTELAVEAVSDAQARAMARVLTDRGQKLYGRYESDQAVTFSAVRNVPGVGSPGGLSVALGCDGDRHVLVDLVRDGPHAVITGITGSGKSELLTTWIAGLCSAYSTREVSFLLADFKGGMTFDALADLPHVTGVITDLDGGSAERAIASLRAEMRRREHELALCGARDIADPRVDLPRLVIVVDEFAALLAEHEGLHRIFADVAARGRALGMHLVLGSQRVSGAMPDALLANCPLRIALRAADSADSRAVIGDDSASRLPGGLPGSGRAFVRRAGDSAPHPLRVALTSIADLADIAASTRTQDAPRSPWLPALPALVTLEQLRERSRREHSEADAGVLLALADDPARQRQFPVALAETGGLAVVGRGASGKSSIIALIAAQAGDAIVVPEDLEGAWDTLMGADESGLWLIDDADDLLARFPPDHSVAVSERLDRIARAGRLVVTARSLSGRLARIVDALPQRALLALSTRMDHVAAGGEGSAFRPDLPPGRGRLATGDVQFAWTDARPSSAPARLASWYPEVLTGVVTRQTDAVVDALRASGDGSRDVRLLRQIPAASRISDIVEESREPQILVGDGEDWLARWGLLQELRARHPLVIDADCATELRTVAGERSLPPYARPGAGRAWLCAPASRPVRVNLLGVT
ncbi:MAG: FtsK/SpoIIIE domain-containing protein [Microbacterium sp.]|uniref:FtsK/SpoIIIE domain-containing protein n=1 Tax=Microbacterium sp. TaxID=51671 RepID=UPI0027205C67|nr:FtsK/SpoIIIE domain-containing protein [Microbacterium sp.]MDO8382907.1 FtsK/SpoIIIE domain-containing protein [Microbacterium sp.]